MRRTGCNTGEKTPFTTAHIEQTMKTVERKRIEDFCCNQGL
jgi:hypothetical protein